MNQSTPLERWMWLGAGGALLAAALQRRSKGSVPLVAAGILMLRQGARGRSTEHELGENGQRRVTRSIAILRSPEALYRAWSDPEKLARFLPRVVSVEARGTRRFEWRLRSPLGREQRWETEVTSDVPNEMIAWRTISGAAAPCQAATIRFRPGDAAERGSVVELELISAWRGAGSAALASAMGTSPGQIAREGLRRAKQLMETGEIATIDGQPAGRRSPVAKLAPYFHPNVEPRARRAGEAA